MNLELLLLGDAPVTRLIERAKLAEASGFAAVWLADERFYREVYTCLGQLAAHSRRARDCVACSWRRYDNRQALRIRGRRG
jgi:5,10-methylenetetrahydromethanopterin reductase